MQIINRKSPSIKHGTKRSLQYIRITERSLYFTAGIVQACGLKAGLFAHFMNDGSEWKFFLNDDTDGFPVTPCNAKGGLQITSAALCTLIKKSTGYTTTKIYQVKQTGAQQDRSPVFEIVNF